MSSLLFFFAILARISDASTFRTIQLINSNLVVTSRLLFRRCVISPLRTEMRLLRDERWCSVNKRKQTTQSSTRIRDERGALAKSERADWIEFKFRENKVYCCLHDDVHLSFIQSETHYKSVLPRSRELFISEPTFCDFALACFCN